MCVWCGGKIAAAGCGVWVMNECVCGVEGSAAAGWACGRHNSYSAYKRISSPIPSPSSIDTRYLMYTRNFLEDNIELPVVQ
ncbi:hypothetical protein HNY73_010510 [Argiope bruennichi]|uniref:Uncharacterized protein n=1 Tax=Argiope bruennichi TaxID=94029 RepID=A0A8T0F3R7_ARGBR|nr:hypothetical protein HNY73_010510 [Argiope bruennichi]